MTSEREDRERSIRMLHTDHRDVWKQKAVDYCADCYLIARIEAADADADRLAAALDEATEFIPSTDHPLFVKAMDAIRAHDERRAK